jgi:actin-related protein 5
MPRPSRDVGLKRLLNDETTRLIFRLLSTLCHLSLSPQSVQFPNVASKFRDRKTQKGVEHAGHDATSPYADVSSRLNLRSPFEGGAVMNADAMECILDYTFFKMGLSGETKVDHPIVMTEPVANLNYSRKGILRACQG